MIPVRLALRNFLSYGEAAEPLAFDQFHVACLSGGNGQGKSALLEAMTWAVWGEGRKSSERRKPDEELLRIGAREMEVEFEFELEGTGYRVRRAYQRSASGKTSKPDLHFHVRDGDAWRSLVRPSVAETQTAIIETLGLDFDTFINSAFLMQGRADEFTRRKPSERKQTLARLLGLGRFRTLEQAAAERLRGLRTDVQLAEAERDRLREALEALPTLEAERADVEQRLAEAADALRQARADAERLATAVRDAEALDRQAAEQRRRLDAITARRDTLARQREALDERIARAGTLLDQAEPITRDHERHQALQEERARLDERLGQKNALDQRRTQLTAEIQQVRAEQRERLSRAEAEHRAAEQRRNDLTLRLGRLPEVRRALADADAAAAEAEALEAVSRTRKELDRQIALAEKALAAERARLEAERTGCAGRIGEDERALSEADADRARLEALDVQLQALPALAEEIEAVREAGGDVARTLDTLAAERARLEAEVAALSERLDRLASVETDACPTCGTTLDEAHRARMDATYRRDREALRATLRTLDADRERLEGRRAELRAQWKERKTRHDALDRLRQERDRLAGQLSGLAGVRERLETTRRRRAELDDLLRRDAFAPDVRARLDEARRRLDATPLDEAALEQVRRRAAAAPALRQQLIDLEKDAGLVETLAQQIEQQAARLVRMRHALDTDEPLGDRPERLREIEARLGELGYDGARHEAVRAELNALAEAPARYQQLLGAREHIVGWREQRADAAEEDGRLRDEAAALEAAHAEAAERLAALPQLRLNRRNAEAHAEEVGRRAEGLQQQRGALEARLDQAGRDRELLAGVRERLRTLKHQRAIYQQLRRAFGKDGIPALLIEQAIPEVEARANAILERLARGRTRVQLETQAEKKTGGTRETLDIRLTDEHGVSRSYETFSGGEAFRVNFALRLALAQLLAERAGVRIRTLVIDEGFGTQDAEGVDAMVEAIQSVRDDFAKILVITHLDGLKDAFPVRIEVEKDPALGSRFEVLGV